MSQILTFNLLKADTLTEKIAVITNLVQSQTNKPKQTKESNEQINYLKEIQSDTKYKTELCKTFTQNNFCPYGSKCRFAHGKQELFDKVINCKKYKQKECMSFFKNFHCCYGTRCHFKHDERKLKDIIKNNYHLRLKLVEFALENNNEEEILFNLEEENLTKLVAGFKNKNRNKNSNSDCDSLLYRINENEKMIIDRETANVQSKFSLNTNNIVPLF
jgi:hypothetical protein